MNLNVGPRSSHHDISFKAVLERSHARFGRAWPNHVLFNVRSEEEVALADIFSIIHCVYLALIHMAQVVLLELISVDGTVVHFMASKVVMRYSVFGDSLLLSNDLLGVGLANAFECCILTEEFVVLI